ncbi:hypothetical protein TUM19329_20000 [Legionella antarctica]|uniref:Uncharacterized protein n=2 Tax=Legionella antarctica TaxID=2708020 RepID=A0A6F8T5B4_9GAMM|nr:hypothetical protein TUM19329_20000 [Legionella antarctica]
MGQDDGYKNLNVLKSLLTLTQDSETTYLSLLTNVGFTCEHLVKILGQKGGDNNFKALKKLLSLTEDTESTYLSQLTQAGFSGDHLVAILGHTGGCNNLTALIDLFLPSPQNNESTYLNLLTEAGFTCEQLVRVLNHTGGSKNLEALNKLLLPLPQDSERSYLNLLIEAGFSCEHMVTVLDNDWGSNNLEALIGILLPSPQDSNSTYFTLLTQAGFTCAHIVTVLGHGGGSMNLDVLKSLLLPLAQDSEMTRLGFLINAGFSCDTLVMVLGHGGGSRNLDALFSLVTNISISHFISSYPGAHDSIVILANGKSRSSHIGFLGAILSKEDLRKEINDGLLLDSLCKKIKPYCHKQLQQIHIDTIPDLKDFCNEDETFLKVRPTNKRKQTSFSNLEKTKKRKGIAPEEMLDLRALLEKLPSGESLNGKLSFLVDSETAESLKKLDKSLTGVKDICKVKNKNQYRVRLVDLSLYHNFYNQHPIDSVPFDFSNERHEEPLLSFPDEMISRFEIDYLPILPDEMLTHFNEVQESSVLAPVSPNAPLLSQLGLFGSHVKEASEMELANKEEAELNWHEYQG